MNEITLCIIVIIYGLIGGCLLMLRPKLIQNVFIIFHNSYLKFIFCIWCYVVVWPIILFYSDEVVIIKLKRILK